MRGTITRLSRLEAKRGPKAEARFYVFGLDEEDAAERYAAELRAGTIQRGDPCTTPLWRSAGPLPTPRWATPRDLTEDELHDGIHHLALSIGRDPLPRDAESDQLGREIAALRQELGPDLPTMVRR